MTNLTAKQEAFIALMAKSDEHAQRGFQILISKSDPEVLFDALKTAGFFDPQKAPGPVPVEEPGYVRIPYWAPLDYLKQLAQLAEERHDTELGEKVMTVVREVTRFRDQSGKARDNYHTYRIFAEIIGLIPRKALLNDDLNLIPTWLDGKYDRSLVASALSKGVITRFLESENREDWGIACAILNYFTELKPEKDIPCSRRNTDVETVVDGYYLKGIIEKHAEKLGHKVGREASSMFVGRIKEVFNEEKSGLPSYMLRPAVEEHEQNRSWKETENCLVEGLRDILLSWVSSNFEGASGFIAEMLKDKNDMIRRIGIYLLNERWTELNSLYGNVVGPDLFDSKHIHELYQLLKRRFSVFNDAYKVATVNAIRLLPLTKIKKDPEEFQRYLKRNWLSAIAGQGFQAADDLFYLLNKEKELGKLSDHPDFHFYMKTGWGSGPSPYEFDELLSFVENGTIVEKLNDFEQIDCWRGPSVKSLVTNLEKVVANQPDIFLRILPQFMGAKRAYQYGIINGFMSLWSRSDYDKIAIDWDIVWEKLIEFFESLLCDPAFWDESVNEQKDLTPTRDWIPSLIAEFLRSGTREDKKSYSPDLLPRTLKLIILLLDNLNIDDEAGQDAMSHAVNSPRGKSLEALFSHALRACRVADKEQVNHTDTWAEMAPIFNKEIEMCMAGTNYDFSTLSGAYLSNLNYLSRDWLHSRVEQIFPFDLLENFRCAIFGLTYASVNRESYKILVSKGVINEALNTELNVNKEVRKKIIERIALAYLWGDETLDSSRFATLLKEDRIDDLISISEFFRSVHKKDLSEKQISLIVDFWEWCVEWSEDLLNPSGRLYSSLSTLCCFLNKIDEKSLALMLTVAPFVNLNHNANKFIEELNRLTEAYPEQVCQILGEVLCNYKPIYDYQNQLMDLLVKLAKSGFRVEVIGLLNKIRHLKNVEQLYNELLRRP